MNSRLNGTRCYLCGPMQFAEDGGVPWRQEMTKWLTERHGVQIFDPCNKPISVGREDKEYYDHLYASGNWDEISRQMRLIRCVDLRMVDICDFLVVHLDERIRTTGTFEELFLANRSKKPVLIHYEQGKERMSAWLYGTFPYQHFFSTWDELKGYIDTIGFSEVKQMQPGDDRWLIFNK